MLKPRSIRELFSLSLMLYRHKLGFLLRAGFCILLPYYIVYAYVVSHHQLFPTQEMQSAVKGTGQLMIPMSSQVWLIVLAAIYVLLVFPILFGMISHMTQQSLRKGEDVTVAEAGNVAFHRLFQTFLTLLLTVVIYLVGASVFGLVIGLLASLLGSVASVLADILAVIGAIALIVGIIWYTLRVLFIPAIVVTEKLSLMKAFRRSFSLTRYKVKQVFGFCLMLFIITFVVETFLTLISSVFFGSGGMQLLITAVISLFVTPFSMVCLSILYTDLRIRKGE